MRSLARFAVLLIIFVFLLVGISKAEDYKAAYNKQLMVNRGMAVTALLILNWFKSHPEYKKFDSIRSRVEGFFEELDKAKQAHFKALDFAKKKDYHSAYEFAKKEWSYLNDIAVKGKKTQDNLLELEGKGESSGAGE